MAEDTPVVRSMDEARSYADAEEVLIPTKGAMAASVLWFSNMLNSPDDSEPGRVIKRLVESSRQSDDQ